MRVALLAAACIFGTASASEVASGAESGSGHLELSPLEACLQATPIGEPGAGLEQSFNINIDANDAAPLEAFSDANVTCSADHFSGSGPVVWHSLADVRVGRELTLSTCDPASTLDTDLAVPTEC